MKKYVPPPIPRHDVNAIPAVRNRARAIGRELRRHLEDTVRQPVPEEWLDILRKIDARRSAA